jgi:hypothetical protein
LIVTIEASKDGVKFTCQGDIGNGAVTLRNHTNVEDEKQSINVELSEPVGLTFSLKYLVNFCKAAGLADRVKICLSNEVPLLVEYKLLSTGNSNLRFYLAPKVRLPSFQLLALSGSLLTPGSLRLATRSKRTVNEHCRGACFDHVGCAGLMRPCPRRVSGN